MDPTEQFGMHTQFIEYGMTPVKPHGIPDASLFRLVRLPVAQRIRCWDSVTVYGPCLPYGPPAFAEEIYIAEAWAWYGPGRPYVAFGGTR